MKTKNNSRTFLRSIGIGLSILLLILTVIAVSVYLWALNSTDTSLIARGIMWGDSDAGDINRFPSRIMRAGSNPVDFELAPFDLLSELPINNDEVQAVNMPLDTYMEHTNTTAFIVLHGDHLIYEAYYNGFGPESLQTSFSVAKSFASTLVGVALDEGFINSLDDPITIYIPELVEIDKRFDAITIRHLITMSSGIRWDRDESNPFSDDFITYYSPDLRDVIQDIEIETAPGERFLYNDYNPILVGIILERATGMSVAEYTETRLWQPMGAEGDGSWSLDSEQSGFEKMFVGLNGRPIDLIKLGWLFLHNGMNDDQQVVPSAWVEDATQVDTTTDPAANYQYYWWVDQDRQAYYAEGDKCQFIYVYPKADLVLARFGTDCGGTGFIGLLGNIAQWLETQLEN
jgi:CubicO group peptidase (beta-lactamase class C family)